MPAPEAPPPSITLRQPNFEVIISIAARRKVSVHSAHALAPHLPREQEPALRQSPRSLPIVIAGRLIIVLGGVYNFTIFALKENQIVIIVNPVDSH
jgi:hypothetical protein